MHIRPKYKNFETRSFNNRGIVSSEIIDDRISSAWRLDYPTNDTASSQNEKFLILICQKILLRGKKTLISPKLENNLRKLFKIKEDENLKANANIFNHFIDTNTKTPYEFDSPLEQKFFEEILPEKLGKFFKKYVLYQAEVIPAYPSSRVDFLIKENTVIELDGDEHNEKKQKSYDKDRDSKLQESGFKIIRITNKEIEERNLEKLEAIKISSKDLENLTQTDKTILAAKLITQVQIVLSEIIYSYGLEDTKAIYFGTSFQPFNNEELNEILSLALAELKELLNNIINLYDLEISLDNISLQVLKDKEQDIKNSPFITFDENSIIGQKSFIIQDIFYDRIDSIQDRVLEEKDIANPDKEIIEFFLNYIFRHTELRDGQLETIQRVLGKKDTITLLPTGAGKSICFQLPSFLFIGNTLIICPITSLMDDQVENLNDKHNIDKAIAIHSKQKNREELRKEFKYGKNVFTYVSPERFQSKEFREDVKNLNTTIPISLIAIDEAHCLSEWGHDFRVAYLRIGKLTRELTNNAPLLALTGTASYSVLNDIKRDLEINEREAIITPRTFDRKELDFFIIEDVNKEESLISILRKDIPARLDKSTSSFTNNPQNGGIIFCPHTRGDYGIKICANLEQHGIDSSFYSSTMKGIDEKIWQEQIKKTAREFKKNKLSLLVATKAFGMGIDKPNIRYTIHYGIPPSIESYYQEAGRAGRDRKKAVSFIIFSNINDELNKEILDLNTSFEQVREKVKPVKWSKQDDVIRQIGFHIGFYSGGRFIGGSFISIEKEKDYLKRLSDWFNKGENFLRYTSGEDRLNKEKSIYRFSILGIVKDYTIDWSKRHFDLVLDKKITNEQILDKYSSYIYSYNRSKVRLITEPFKEKIDQPKIEFVQAVCISFINFIYDNIEKSRRRSLREMFLLAKEGLKENNLVRKRILSYLETNYSEEIEELINNELILGDEDIKHLKNMIEGYEEVETGEMKGGIRTAKEASELRGEVARYLEAQSDHPELLFLRSISEVFCSDCNEGTVMREFNSCIAQAKEYKVEEKQIIKTIILFIEEILYAEEENLIKETFKNHLIKNNDAFIKGIFKHDFQDIDIKKYAFYNLINNKITKYVEGGKYE